LARIQRVVPRAPARRRRLRTLRLQTNTPVTTLMMSATATRSDRITHGLVDQLAGVPLGDAQVMAFGLVEEPSGCAGEK